MALALDNFRKIYPRRRTSALISLGLVLGLFVLTFYSTPTRQGDGQYYLAMALAIADHGWPSITPEVIARVQERFGDPSFVMLRLGADQNFYAWHFFVYPLFAVPVLKLLQMFNGDIALSLPLLNVAISVWALWAILRSSQQPRLLRIAVIGVFTLSVTAMYLWWPGPEIFTASLLFVASMRVIERRFPSAVLLSAIAATQNPSVIFFGILFGLLGLIELIRNYSNRGHWTKDDYKSILLMAIAGLVAAFPYFWNQFQFGVLNPIVDEGYIDYSQIGWRRFHSLFFDLNQGVLIWSIAATLLLAWGILIRLRTAYLEKEFNWRASDLLLVVTVLIALPALAQTNWNNGQAVFVRYGTWVLAPLIVWAAINAIAANRRHFTRIVVSVSLAAQAVLVILSGGPYLEAQPVYNQHKTIARVALSRLPEFYNPDPEIFLMRTRITPEFGDYPRAYWGGEGILNKILIRSSDISAASQMVCGLDSKLIRTRPSLREVVHVSPDYTYLNGPFRCGTD